MYKKLLVLVIIALLATCAFADKTDNLRAYWSLDGGSGAAHNSAYDMTINGSGVGAIGNDKPGALGGGGASFDGTSSTWMDNIGTDKLGITNAFTLAGWVKFADNGASDFKSPFGSEYGSFYSQKQGPTILKCTVFATGPPTQPSCTAIADDTWHHFAATYDGTTETIYTDGVAGQTAANSGNVIGLSATGRFYIGAYGDSSKTKAGTSTRTWLGGVDEVAIWNRALNGMEIGQVYGDGVPEPATICLLGLGGLALLRRKR